MNQIKVLGIIVTYNPEPNTVTKLIEILAAQVAAIVLIDNASDSFSTNELLIRYPHLHTINNSENVGVATAYNQGCAIAKAQGFSHVILFDQDSIPASDMVNCLTKAMVIKNQDELIVAAAGPKYTDIKGQKLSPFVRIKDFHLERVNCADGEVVEIDHLISSGSLIDIRAIDAVGNFVDGLFIDCVDTEWCLRARHNKLIILGVGNAAMQHNIGDAYLILWGRQLPIHSPVRLYYQFRNQVWLIKQPWTGWRWRIIDTIRCMKLFIVFIFFAPNKINNLTYMMRGIFDGVLSRLGQYRK